MPWTLLFSLFTGIPGIVGDYFKKKQEIEETKLNVELALQQANIDLAKETAKAQMQLATTMVGATSPKFKYLTFIMWFGPFVLGVLWPKMASEVFANLGNMPEWYVQSCMLIMFTVWGISVASPVVNSIFSGLGNFMQSGRDYKLEKAKINREAYYNALRKVQGSVSDADVKRDDAVFNELDKG